MRACRRLRNSSAPSAALLQTIGRPQTLSMTRSKGSFTGLVHSSPASSSAGLVPEAAPLHPHASVQGAQRRSTRTCAVLPPTTACCSGKAPLRRRRLPWRSVYWGGGTGKRLTAEAPHTAHDTLPRRVPAQGIRRWPECGSGARPQSCNISHRLPPSVRLCKRNWHSPPASRSQVPGARDFWEKCLSVCAAAYMQGSARCIADILQPIIMAAFAYPTFVFLSFPPRMQQNMSPDVPVASAGPTCPAQCPLICVHARCVGAAPHGRARAVQPLQCNAHAHAAAAAECTSQGVCLTSCPCAELHLPAPQPCSSSPCSL